MLRKDALTKEEKQMLQDMLVRLKIMPPVAGCIGINLDSNQQVASIELQKAVWR